MNTVTQKPTTAFFSGSRVISEPHAVVTVKELTLTEAGRRALTSGSTGITQGAREALEPLPLPKKETFA